MDALCELTAKISQNPNPGNIWSIDKMAQEGLHVQCIKGVGRGEGLISRDQLITGLKKVFEKKLHCT